MAILRTDGHNGYQVETADFKAVALPPGLESIATASSRVSYHRRRRAQLEESPKDRYWRQLRELRAAGGFLEHEFPRKNVMLTAQRHFEGERVARDFIREVKHRFGQQQQRDGYPRWHFEVLEATCSDHSHLVGPLSMARAEQLLEYAFDGVAYGQFIDIVPIVPARGGMRGLIGYGAKNPGYLGKELGQKYVLHGGGEKIRFSDAFRDELVKRDLITDRIRFYASRALPPVEPKNPAPAIAVATPIPVHDTVVTQPIEPVQFALFDEGTAPVIDIRAAVETKRVREGKTQGEVAAIIFAGKQPNYSNVIVRRHDPLGAFARRRALEWLRAAA